VGISGNVGIFWDFPIRLLLRKPLNTSWLLQKRVVSELEIFLKRRIDFFSAESRINPENP
jgi:hypothetical protein